MERSVSAKLFRLSPMSKTITPPCPEHESGPKYWRSLDQLADTPEFRRWVEREFPSGASELTDPVTRRHFMKIMSASFLLAGLGLSGCRRPESAGKLRPRPAAILCNRDADARQRCSAGGQIQ
jgi:MoCo/4Fe-4S cofactor protein with predicted Tat translocation signal